MQTIIKAALKYFGFFMLIYGVLTLFSLIPAVGSFCNYIYRQPTGAIVQTLLPKVFLQLKGEENNPDMIRVEYASKEKVQQQMEEARRTGQANASIQGMDFEFGFYNLFLSFFLFFIALMLLSPLSIKEKAIGILIGTILFYLFTVLKMYFALFVHFSEPEIGIYQSGGGYLKFVRSILYFMTLGTNVLTVLVIWAVLVFRKNNWKEMLGTTASLLNHKK